MTLGERLLDLRKQNNLSQEDAAEKLNVTRQTISKWETNQTTPDFDKILPICALYQITAGELLTGRKIEQEEPTKKQENSKLLIFGIFLYFLSVIWIILGVETLNIEEGIVVSIFLLICGIATCTIVYYCCNLPKKKDKLKEESPREKIKNSIIEITAIVFCCLYFVISFFTMAWHITWIIWIIYAIVEEIIKIYFELGSGKNE